MILDSVQEAATIEEPNEMPEEPVETIANTEAGGDFIDDDFGLSIKKEWEHLRQQQMLIEEEINNIQKETTTSKPPPPYSPPTAASPGEGQRSPRKLPQLKPESPRFVPSSKDQLPAVIDSLVSLCVLNKHSLDLLTLSNDDLDPLLEGPPQHKESQRVFLRFLFDMIKDFMREIFSAETDRQNPPWMTQKSLSVALRKIPATTPDLQTFIRKKVLVAFNHERKAEKENLIIRWSHKRRDRVDQVLVRELHGEEAAWIDYEKDEVQVKDELSNVLLDSLISDTVQAFKKVVFCP